MSLEVLMQVYIFVLAGFVGYQVISLVGSLVAAGADHGPVSTALGVIAVTAATINVVGGFMITDRMLKMFKLDRKDRP